MEHPDEWLEPQTLSLQQFVQRSLEFFQELEHSQTGFDNFLKFTLAGRLQEGESQRRVLVNPRHGGTILDRSCCTLTGDFDSLIGFTDTLPLKVPLAVYPVPSFKDTLSKTIHLKLEIRQRGVRSMYIGSTLCLLIQCGRARRSG